MNGRMLGLSLLAAACCATLASAETLVVNDQVVVRESGVARPDRGLTMGAVEAKFGAPQDRHAAVGKPAITRWDYAGFSVFFENDRVIHAVATGS
jgi:hypothetical protein